jgi:DEAD/DEAH box helicase domain-containing protein
MSAFQSLAPRQPGSLETVQSIFGSLFASYRQEEVLTAVRQIPAREAKFGPVPAWVARALAEAYRAKGIQALYSHQAASAELVRDGKNAVIVTPTASGKTLCYNLPVLNAVLEKSRHSRALPVPDEGACPGSIG